MTNEEFLSKFLPKIYFTLPSLRKWVEETSPNKDATQGNWFKALQGCELADCVAVLDEIATGDFRVEAYDRDYIAVKIKDRANEIHRSNAPRHLLPAVRLDRSDPTYRCPQCRDTGMVQCVHPVEFKKVQEGKSLDEMFDVAMFRCNCAFGEWQQSAFEESKNPNKGKPMLVYLPSKCVAVGDKFLTTEEKQELTEICFPTNLVVRDFAEWG